MNFDIQNFIGFATILGIWVGFWQYFRNKYDKQDQIIKSLEAHLAVASVWSRVNDEGYREEPNDEQKLNYSHPFRFIFEVESSTIKNIFLQPGIVNFSKEFHKAVAEFNQAISTLSEMRRFLEELSFNNPEISRIIEERLNAEESKVERSMRNHSLFMDSFTQNETVARYVADKIYNFNYQLHYKFIGSEKSGALNQAHHLLLNEIEKQKKKINKENFISAIFLGLSSIFLIISLFSIWNISYNNLISWILIFISVALITIYLLFQKYNMETELYKILASTL